MDSLQIIQLSSSFFAELRDLHKKCLPKVNYADESYMKFLEQELFKTYGCLTALKEFLGFIILTVNCDEADIISICVDERYRRKGIARSLIEHSIRENKIKSMFLEVSVENKGAILFYQNIGFGKIGIRKKYSNNEDYVSMSLSEVR